MAIRVNGYKVGSNDPCPCGKKKGDGKPVKFKHCCQFAFLRAQNFGVAGAPLSIQAALADPKEVAASEIAEVHTFIEYMKTNPEAVPGDTILQFARKHSIDLGEKYTPKSKISAVALLGILAASMPS
jgi:hypothetical protein